jgi:hypothetical protein
MIDKWDAVTVVKNMTLRSIEEKSQNIKSSKWVDYNQYWSLNKDLLKRSQTSSEK